MSRQCNIPVRGPLHWIPNGARAAPKLENDLYICEDPKGKESFWPSHSRRFLLGFSSPSMRIIWVSNMFCKVVSCCLTSAATSSTLPPRAENFVETDDSKRPGRASTFDMTMLSTLAAMASRSTGGGGAEAGPEDVAAPTVP